MSSCFTDKEIEYVARRLIDRSLPKAAWTHAAHLAAALWLLKHRGLLAMGEMPPLIAAYNEATGVANTDTGGYHETITQASLRAAHSWLQNRPDAPLNEVLREMLAAPIGRSDWLFSYWSKPLLFFSDGAEILGRTGLGPAAVLTIVLRNNSEDACGAHRVWDVSCHHARAIQRSE